MASRSRFGSSAVSSSSRLSFSSWFRRRPDHEELGVHPDGVAYEAQLLGADPGGNLEVPAPHEEGVQGRVAGLLVQARRVREVVDENQDLVELLHLELLAGLGDLALLADDLPQRRLVPVLEVDLLPVRGDFHGLLDVLLHGAPAVVHVDAWAEDVDALKAALGTAPESC